MSESFDPEVPQQNSLAPKWDPVPGAFDHRGLDCATHGENVAHARTKDTKQRFMCVRCMLETLAKLAEEERYGRTQP